MAVVDYFLKIDGVDGESTDSKHKASIDVESWSWGETNSGDAATRGGMGAGKVAMQDFHFVMRVNKATPKLFEKCATGEHIKKAVLTCRKAGKDQQEYLKVTLEDLIVSSYQTGGSGHGEVVPVDQVSLNFSKIEFEYKEQKSDGSLGGSVKAGYDLKANKKV
ncbi:Hcp family type VI secretion system effector [Paludisphaera mucosa]|uniref:Type VI secretion system tube protein Hcp n=1 Tax=Paludisphaera mucosa TaxID=3030827 RepID=A0ABT6FE68_9BACT|nr:type VI secretion system tube protein Hcp [Paludisphaera mucosa]MDG3005786.1 type VI secretion system tube protein Hcp [Paludisphaera mucosa]